MVPEGYNLLVYKFPSSSIQPPQQILHLHFLVICKKGVRAGSPARTFGWRHPGYIHNSFLKDLWPNTIYTYNLGHQLFNGSYVWSSKLYSFRASPYPGQDSRQHFVIFGDMVKSGRKETALDLAKFVDKGVQVKLTGGRQVTSSNPGCREGAEASTGRTVQFEMNTSVKFFNPTSSANTPPALPW